VNTARTVKHLSVHRIADAELRVVADVEAGVLPLFDLEERVIRRYMRAGHWIHRWVTLFILQDLAPLARQLETLGGSASQPTAPDGMPGRARGVGVRPVICVYDLADLSSCQVYVSEQALREAGLWDDPVALEALLAHEHAHPLSENALTGLSRRLRASLDAPADGAAGASALVRWLTHLADDLVCKAPRELQANELLLRVGWVEALRHLNGRTLASFGRDLVGRGQLAGWLNSEAAQGRMAPGLTGAYLLGADLRQAGMALEIASFVRAGQESPGRRLEAELRAAVLAQLDPQVTALYDLLLSQYRSLRPDCGPDELVAWGQSVAQALADAMATRGLVLGARVSLAPSAQ
jgi:hypothetical protein